MLGQWLRHVGCREDDVLVFLAHNAPFDKRIMKKAIEKAGLEVPNNWMFYDSIKIFKQIYPGLPSYSLKNLCNRFELQEPTHRSLDDVNCLLKMLKKGFQTLSYDEISRKVFQHIFE